MKISIASLVVALTTSLSSKNHIQAANLTARGVESLGFSDSLLVDDSTCMYNMTITFKHNAELPIPSGPADCDPTAEGGPALAPDGIPYLVAREHYKLMDEDIRKNTPFNHYGIDFQPCGHPAIGVFTVPHYDVHIYLMDVAMRELMTCELVPGAPVCNPAAQSTPQGQAFFEFDNGAIPADVVGHAVDMSTALPHMGIHSYRKEWYSVEAAMAANLTIPFLRPVFVSGGYNNTFIFWEPMIPLAFMSGDEDQFFEEDISYVGDESPYLPSYLSVAYTASTGEVTIFMKGGMAMDCTIPTESPTPTAGATGLSTMFTAVAVVVASLFL